MTEDHAHGDQRVAIEAELCRLIYRSRNCISASPAETVAEIESILAISRRNNSACAITGALIFNSGIFAQVLEGSRSAVEAAFDRIQRDPRHDDVNALVFEPATQRLFPAWSMAFIGRSLEGCNLFAHFRISTDLDARRLRAERILSLMREIALEEEESD